LDSEIVAARWLVSGRVQGVGFRAFVVRAAAHAAVRGDVRNLPDGRVEIRAVGARQALAGLLADVRLGPGSPARVDGVETLALEGGLDFERFGVRR
jgi:acylphosphatase